MAVLGIRPDTLLDVGAGIGVLHHELLQGRCHRAVHVEAAAAYIEAARAEALGRGHGPRIDFRHGDFLALAPELAPADLVTLDRVVCCYPDLEPLVRESADKARRYNPFRTFIHPVTQIHSVLQEAGLEVRISRRTLGWVVLVCTRPTPPDPGDVVTSR